MAVKQTGVGGWNTLQRATDGAHVDVWLGHGANDPDLVQNRQRLAELARAPGVTAAGGPWNLLYTKDGELGGERVAVQVQIRDAVLSAVDRPVLTAGTWLDGGDGV